MWDLLNLLILMIHKFYNQEFGMEYLSYSITMVENRDVLVTYYAQLIQTKKRQT